MELATKTATAHAAVFTAAALGASPRRLGFGARATARRARPAFRAIFTASPPFPRHCRGCVRIAPFVSAAATRLGMWRRDLLRLVLRLLRRWTQSTMFATNAKLYRLTAYLSTLFSAVSERFHTLPAV